LARNQITTVDIGTNSVKIMQLGLTQKGLIVMNSGLMAYPRSSAVEKVSDDVIVDTITQLIREKGFKTNHVSLSIPRHFVTVKGLSGLPASANEEELERMIPMQIETELPFPIEESIYSAYNFQNSRDSISLEVVATKKSSVERYVDIAEKVKLKLKSIIPSIFATYAIVFDQFKDDLANKSIGVADIGAGGTDMCIIQHGRMAFSRSFTHGGNNLTNMFEKEYGLSFEDAERQKITEASLHSELMDPLATQWADNLATQITQSVRAFTGKDAGEGIDGLWLCGGSSQIPGLDNYLSERLGIDVRPLDHLNSVESYLVKKEEVLSEKILTVNLGLGIIALGGKDRAQTVNVNLLPKEIIERAKQARKKLMIIFSTALAVIILAGAGWGIIAWRNSSTKSLKEMNAQIQKLEKDVVIAHAKESLEKSILMERIMVPYVTPLEVLREMHEKLPNRDKIALTSFQLDKTGKLTISIEAMSHADIGETLRVLNDMKFSETSNLFSDVKNGTISKITKDNKPILQVQIICTFNKEKIQEDGKNEKNNKS
jgi:type IV pilus assembly protein PilM